MTTENKKELRQCARVLAAAQREEATLERNLGRAVKRADTIARRAMAVIAKEREAIVRGLARESRAALKHLARRTGAISKRAAVLQGRGA